MNNSRISKIARTWQTFMWWNLVIYNNTLSWRLYKNIISTGLIWGNTVNGEVEAKFSLSGLLLLMQPTSPFVRTECSRSHWVFKSLWSNLKWERLLKLMNIYTNSLVNVDSFYVNFTNRTFQKFPIPHLTHSMKQKFLH